MSDPFNKANPFKTKGATNFDEAHSNADTDADRTALHHTLGTGPMQAAAGNHKHKAADMVPGQGQPWNANVRQQGGAALAHTPQFYRYYRLDNLVVYYLVVLIQATPGNNVQFDLPVPLVNVPSHAIALGSGRENAATGELLTVFSIGSTLGLIASKASLTAINGWQLSVSGTYLVDMIL